MREINRKKTVVSVVAILVLVILVIGVTYAAFTFSKAGTTVNSVSTGTVTMTYTEGKNGITINNAMPMEDAVGKVLTEQNQMFDFTVDINIVGKTAIAYEVTADKADTSTLANDEVRLYLEKSLDGTNYTEIMAPSNYSGITANDDFGAKSGEMVMDTGNVSVSTTNYYRLRMWVAKSYELTGTAKTFTVKVNVYGKTGTYTAPVDDNIPNTPAIVGDMIPVIYNGTNWVKADKTNTNNSWYNYDNQNWANVVTIKDPSKRAGYVAASAGTTIDVADINTFLVWIPRYSYTLGNTYGYQIDGASTPSAATPGAFDIKFVKKNTLDTGSASYTGSTADNYYTPASFCWGDTCDTSRNDASNVELSGIWVAKFETTGTIDAISSIPNVTSLRSQTNAAFFNGIQTGMNGTNGTTNYGFSGSNYDTHMLKNNEWGAMAYLSQSKYGKYGNSDYTGANKEIYQNKSTWFITGSSNGTPSTSTTNTQAAYNVSGNGTGASTTGNISGIYDTSGGAWEAVMGSYNNMISSSGFSGMPSRRYYSLYTTESSSTACNGGVCLGDALSETASIYGDFTNMVNASYSWVYRSGGYDNGAYAGAFGFHCIDGSVNGGISVRLGLVAW